MSEPVITGLAANDPVPGTYVEVAFAQGEAGGSAEERSILLIGNKLSAGTATVDTQYYGPVTPVPLQTEEDAIALFGAGSELHRMFRMVTAVNKVTSTYAIAVTESAGAQATGTITITGTATGNGQIRTWVGPEFVDTAITTGDTPTIIAGNVVANINAKTHWGAAASNSAGVITLTAKQRGPRGNFIRYQTLVTASITTAATASADTAFTGGTTSDDNTNALATILPKKFYYIASAHEDATNLGRLSTHIDSQAAPTVGLRQVSFAGFTDTLANGITLATGRNQARMEIAWSKHSPHTPSELAANQAAVEALFETSGASPRCNFASFGNDAETQPYWRLAAPRNASSHPTRADIKAALNNGLSPIGVNPNGSTYLVNRITTRSLSGSVTDYRIRDRHKVTICDFFGDDTYAKTVLNFSGRKIANDPPKGARTPGPDVVTPTLYKSSIFAMLDSYETRDLLDNVQAVKDGTIVVRSTSPTTRMLARVPLRPIDCAFQFGVYVAQVF